MKKQHQHFIPQVYLRKFAHTQDGDNYFVDTFNKVTGELKPSMSIANICGENDLYTLKNLGGNQKYTVENFFSKNIESEYNRVYELLVQEKKKIISADERVLILNTILSMYFRTPKALNQFVTFSATLIDQVKKELDIEVIDFLGYKISVKEKSFTDLKKEIKENNRLDYIKTQLILLNEFIKFRAYDGLVVIELVGEQEFITSDNPVEIGNSFGGNFSLFDTSNSIYIPLDSKHVLFIAPKKEMAIVNQIFYWRDNFSQHIVTNKNIFENAERWIIGSETSITKFLKDKAEYDKPANKNHYLVTKEKIELIQKLEILIEGGISNDNQKLVNFLKNLPKHDLYNKHIDLQNIYNKMKEVGLQI